MKIEITVSQLKCDAQNEITIDLSASNGVGGQVKIDFANLLQFAKVSSPVSFDFFVISTCVYGVDRLIKRRKNSVDGWSRELKIKFPVSVPSKWQTQKRQLDQLLSFLTGDYWEVEFYKSNFSLPKAVLNPHFEGIFEQVNLFSGGLDSLIGAIDFLKANPKKRILFVSHYDPQMHGPKGDQEVLLHKIRERYPDQFSSIPSARIYLDHSNDSKETTFRSRSILFMGIALLVAEAKGIDIIVPENGTVSLNYPLSPSRRSACSTRTTHPTLFLGIQKLWNDLAVKSLLTNPYELKTKGEMVNGCKDQVLLKELVSLSNSCGKRGHRVHWDEPGATHCGVCMPCIYRRSALLVIQDKKTTYGSELNSLFPFQTKKGQDASACLDYLKKEIGKKEIRQELFINGLKDISKINSYINLIERTRNELKQWIATVGNRQIKSKAGL